MKCARWHDSGWVCEDHEDRPSIILTEGGCDCGGAAVPCTCNPEAIVDMAVIATVDPESVREWVHEPLSCSSSMWAPQDAVRQK